LQDTPPDVAMHLFRVATMIVPAVTRVAKAEGVNIVVNSGSAAGQDEPHYHVHVIPRCENDGFDIPLPFHGSQMPDRTKLDAIAVQIITALRDPTGTLRSKLPDRRRKAVA
jgi:histidine triad (HIT) family protein